MIISRNWKQKSKLLTPQTVQKWSIDYVYGFIVCINIWKWIEWIRGIKIKLRIKIDYLWKKWNFRHTKSIIPHKITNESLHNKYYDINIDIIIIINNIWLKYDLFLIFHFIFMTFFMLNNKDKRNIKTHTPFISQFIFYSYLVLLFHSIKKFHNPTNKK